MLKAFRNISKTDLQVASDQLWKLFAPHINYLPEDKRKIVELAFLQMVMAHGEMRRKSGEFYIVHPVAAALTLTDMIHLDHLTIAACLLHDVPEDTQVSLKDLSRDFDREIIFLIEGVTKFSSVKYKGEKRYAENIRKMFVAMSKDIRIIFIKLADRIHNLQTLEFVRPDKQYRIALESLEIYAPIADRLGMNEFRGIIEDLAFPYVYPEEYKELVAKSEVEIERRQKITKDILKRAKTILTDKKIHFIKTLGRAKKYYSIYKKMKFKQKKLEEVYDLIALRIITDTTERCYEILSTIHSYFTPLAGRIKDYIAEPKENGYQSIHTTVKDNISGQIVEFQIRTAEMHEYAEFGAAMHWAYKDNGSRYHESDFDPAQYKWIQDVVKIGKQRWFVSNQDYLRRVKIKLYNDRIFVMTPKNDVIELQNGATALDFAFKVHEEVGKKAVMAIINGKPTKLEEKLKNGDQIEIITNKKQNPTIDWLGKVFTSNAIGKIRTLLNREAREKERK